MDGQFVEVRVLFFAKSKELVGKSESVICLPCRTTREEVMIKVKEQFPRIEELGECFTLSLNEEYLPDEHKEPLKLSEKDEIAIIPPLSGG